MVATKSCIASRPLSEAFSPLFVGAMVATRKVEARIEADWKAFSPLFVGAMVATTPKTTAILFGLPFSPLFVGAMVATLTTAR